MATEEAPDPLPRGGADSPGTDELRGLWDLVPYIVYIFDRAEQRTLYTNRHVGAALGYSPQAIAALGDDALARLLHPDDLARLPDLLTRWERVADGEVLETEHRLLHADGTYRWFLGRDAVHSRDAHGRVRTILGTSIDITSRKDLQLELSRAHTLEAVGRLAGGVAHDFNNLLTAILSNVALARAALARRQPPDGYLGEIDQIARSAAQLTRQLLTFARLQPATAEPSPLDDEIRSAVPMLRRLIEEHVEIVCDLAAPAAHVVIERAQLAQVLLNLAVNARDAMPRGGRLTIRTRLPSPGAHDGPTRHALLSVEDTGAGMSPETLRRIFEPFFTTKSHGGGTGLGLSTVYGVVRQSGGHLSVRSELTRGTCFEVHLRLADLPPPAAAPPHSLPPPADHPRRRILVVEDNPMLARVLTELFTLESYEVHAAPDGESGLALAREKGPFDIVLCDIVMPRMRGTDVARRLAEESPQTRIILWSGYPDDPDLPDDLPHVRFVHKPLEAERLLAIVDEMLPRD